MERVCQDFYVVRRCKQIHITRQNWPQSVSHKAFLIALTSRSLQVNLSWAFNYSSYYGTTFLFFTFPSSVRHCPLLFWNHFQHESLRRAWEWRNGAFTFLCNYKSRFWNVKQYILKQNIIHTETDTAVARSPRRLKRWVQNSKVDLGGIRIVDNSRNSPITASANGTRTKLISPQRLLNFSVGAELHFSPVKKWRSATWSIAVQSRSDYGKNVLNLSHPTLFHSQPSHWLCRSLCFPLLSSEGILILQ